MNSSQTLRWGLLFSPPLLILFDSKLEGYEVNSSRGEKPSRSAKGAPRNICERQSKQIPHSIARGKGRWVEIVSWYLGTGPYKYVDTYL